MKFNSDIDIDCADREQILSLIKYIPSSIREGKQVKKHNTGIHVTDIPIDYVNNLSAIDHKESEDRGYVKLDLLNVGVYRHVRNESHLIELMREPDWSLITDRTITEKIIHINRHYETMRRMPEPIDSIPRMAMFIAVIRPGKRHLIGKTWKEVAETIWSRDEQAGYTFRKAHAIAYAQLVAVNINLYEEMPTEFVSLV
jgi:hypothetical protein